MILGIDPGASGAIAAIARDGTITLHDMPTLDNASGKQRVNPALLVETLARLDGQVTHAVVEAVHAMPGQGVSSTFAFGRSLGVIEGALAALDIPTTLVAPATWKRVMDVPASKDGARVRALQLAPQMAGELARKKDHGRAEALLLALYGARTFGLSAPAR